MTLSHRQDLFAQELAQEHGVDLWEVRRIVATTNGRSNAARAVRKKAAEERARLRRIKERREDGSLPKRSGRVV